MRPFIEDITPLITGDRAYLVPNQVFACFKLKRDVRPWNVETLPKLQVFGWCLVSLRCFFSGVNSGNQPIGVGISTYIIT